MSEPELPDPGRWRLVGNDVILGAWFEPDDVIQRIESVQADHVGTRTRIGYRLRVTNAGGSFTVEQQAYLDLVDGKITWMRVLCSGFVPDVQRVAAPADVPLLAPALRHGITDDTIAVWR